MKRLTVATLALCACAPLYAQAQTQITIATVNNPQMVVMKKLTPYFEKAHPNIQVVWNVMPENELRQKVTLDIAQNAGSYDIVSLGAYSTPIWAKNGWLAPLNKLPKSYDIKDLMKPVRQALSYQGKLYALPFYAESSMTYYRKDLFRKAGLTMPKRPTWMQVEQFAKKLNDPANNVYGICLRGLPGWGENMALFGTMVNTYGGRWFNMKWQPQLTTPAWHEALNMYLTLLDKYGPSGATSNGFVENESLFASGHCAMWVDATVAAGYLSDPKTSKVANEVGFAQAPFAKTPRGSHWFWTWALAIPKDTKHMQAARTFIEWATSKQYIDLVGKTQGWVNLPPGTRYSTYENPKYKAAAPYAGIVLKSINTADPNHPTLDPVPYTGVQFVSIPQFQAIGTQVGQNVAAALAGQMSADQTLQRSQSYVTNIMKQAGYLK